MKINISEPPLYTLGKVHKNLIQADGHMAFYGRQQMLVYVNFVVL